MKKFLLYALSLVLVAAISIGGTLAYLQSSDSDVNVMTLGNVKIEQNEYERVVNDDGTYKTETIDNVTSYVLQDYTQGKPLVPSAINTTTWEGWDWDPTIVRMTQVGSYGGMNVFKAASNAQDKFVTVKNTGKTDAFVRTLVAIEIGDASASLIGTSYHQTWTKNEVGTIVVDGNTYYVFEYVYNGANGTRHDNGILPAGDTSYPNLSQVYIQSRATNEDMEKLDGNGNGTLDILVLSQAVQAAGFADAKTALDTAFGKSSEKAAEWFDGVWEEAHAIQYTPVASQDELTAALNDSKNPILTTDITVSSPAQVGAGITFNGDGNTIYSPNVAVNVAGGSILNTNMIGTDFPVANGGIGSVQFAGTTLEEDITIENVNISGFANAIDLDAAGNTVYIKDSELQNSIHIAYADEVVFENCHFTSLNNQFIKTGNIYIYGNMKFVNCHFEENVNFFLDMQGLSGTLEFENCTYGNNGVEDRPFEPTVGFFTWWMNSQHYGTFNEGNPARTNFTCIVDGTVVWSAS